jgi:hypothetical protein
VDFYKPVEKEKAIARVNKVDKNKGIVCIHAGMNLLVPAREILSGMDKIKEGDVLELEIIKVRYQIGRYTAVARVYSK